MSSTELPALVPPAAQQSTWTFEPVGSEPIRAELFGLEHLENHAAALARAAGRGLRQPGRNLMARFSENRRHLVQVHQFISDAYRRNERLGSNAEWFLDNFHIINEVLREIQTDLPSGYYQLLPKRGDGPLAGFPCVFALAVELVAHTDSGLDEAKILQFVRGYQSVVPLEIGELWAVPTMLRLVLIENLRRLADRIVKSRAEQTAATQCTAPLLSLLHGEAEGAEVALPADLQLPPHVSDECLVQMLELFREEPAGSAGVQWLEDVLHQRGSSTAEVLRRQHQHHAASQVSIGNSVTSLRLLSAMDWTAFFERTSHVEALLREDPSGIYQRQDVATRDRCRRTVEKLARGSKTDEAEVARLAVDLAVAAVHSQPAKPGPADQPDCRHCISYYLLDDGRARLEQQLGYRPSLKDRLTSSVLHHSETVYFGGIGLFTLLIVALLVWIGVANVDHNRPVFAVVIALAVLLPVSELAIGLMNRLIVWLLPPRILPKLNFKEGVPADCPTFIVMPSLLTRAESVATLLDRLERHYLGNTDPQLWFALLTDLADSPQEETPEDRHIIELAVASIKALNERYARNGPDRFYLFHRRRLWNPMQGCWMGWERKRGKLTEFNRLLRGDTSTSFVVQTGDLAKLPRIRFVITLDADTQMPHETVRRLVATLAHPLNHPQLDPAQKRVVRGYGVLQPRIGFTLPGSQRSLFAWLFSGSAGLDPYTTAVSDVYQDLFGLGSFIGKGIYDVDAFEAATGRAFPENRILSHDLIEGNYARCGLVTDIELLDDFPARYHSFARREHRWVRGDWQIIAWLFPTVPTADGRTTNPLPMVERWKIFDNLRRSFLGPSLIVLLLLGWLWFPLPLFWSGVVFLVMTWPFWLHAGCSLVQSGQKLMCATNRNLPGELGATAGQTLLGLVFLPDQAQNALDAIVRTLARLLVTHRKLLEWETAATTERRLGPEFRNFVRFMWPATASAVVIAAAVGFVRTGALIVAAPWLVLWAISPAVAYWVSRPRAVRVPTLSADDQAYLHRVARKTWSFFEKFVGEEDHWLPPDNYQEDPRGIVAHRTSPTNIGLYLLSCLAAHDLGYLSLEAMADRLAKTFDTLDVLERSHGHFCNWYDTETLRPLHPVYLSTVDSGNFMACLLTLHQGLRESRPEASDELCKRCELLADRARLFAAAMDFKMLFNESRDLFAVGYNLSQGRLDSAHYDLLASEACLTSYLTVARGDVPRRHWFQLARPLTRVAGEIGLLSWGGTMFEYLMPRLLLDCLPGTLLDESHRAVVLRQIEYGNERAVPWGISESAYATVDAELNYQYQAFGVPGLGLKVGLGKDLVIAPYATGLAVMLSPEQAVANFRYLADEGAEGAYGFYESIDYTAERLPPQRRSVIVKCFMAHHQGMTLLAIANRLLGNRMQRRFHAEPMVRAAELLLQERVPVDAPLIQPPPDEPAGSPTAEVDAMLVSRRLSTPHTAHPRTHLLSNGTYSAMLTNTGAGRSWCGDLDVTRWREDRTCDSWGQFFYIRNVQDGKIWSAGYQPMRTEADEFEIIYSTDKAEFRRLDGHIETRMEIVVSPEHQAEVRRIMLTNHSMKSPTLEVTSYAELVLAPHSADLAHPAFQKLFLETEVLSAEGSLLCRRRPRAADQKPIWAVHALAVDGERIGNLQYETDRAKFLGRCRTPACPAAMLPGAVLSGSLGAVVDPIFSLRQQVRIRRESSVSLFFTTAVAESRDEAMALADQYHDPHNAGRAFELAWAHSMVELRHLHITAEEAHLFQRLAAHVIYSSRLFRAAPSVLASNRLGQPGLWRHGISGDYPIVLALVGDTDQFGLVRQLVAAHSFWRLKGLTADLVILNEQPGGYFENVQPQLLNMIRSSGARDLLDKPGGIFVRRAAVLSAEDQNLLRAAARCIFYGGRGSLASQLDRMERSIASPERPREPLAAMPAAETPAKPQAANGAIPKLLFDNGIGGFTADGREYVIRVGPNARPPQPWINVIANPLFGFFVSESGAGCTWAGNSQQNRLTPWKNDPVTDPPGELIYLRDEESKETWTPMPFRNQAAAFIVRHAQGYTTFEHERGRLRQELCLFVPPKHPVKIFRLKLRNGGNKLRRLSAWFYAEWVLGTVREQTAPYIVTEVDSESGALTARNAFNDNYSTRLAFANVSVRPRTVTADRTEFIGRNGSLDDPAALRRAGLSEKVGPALDPCAAIQVAIEVPPGEERILVFLLGQADNLDEVRRLSSLYRIPGASLIGCEQAVAQWDAILGTVQVRTPNPALDLLLNRWLLYQVLSCRYWGRSALYQSAGAYGFRDQLQDVLALLHARPDQAREHILRAAGRQFTEGDVQHWWHPPSGAGVRTRISDDFLWLPYAVIRYVTATADRDILDETVPFLESPPLKPEQEEDYRIPVVGAVSATVYEHCLRAIRRGLRTGPHGLPLIGTGDWNDGMNRVGAGGKGESVWNAWFLIGLLRDFAVICEDRNHPDQAHWLRGQADRLQHAVESNGWDGQWYRRAYFDDGTPLGSATNDVCKIDSLAQSWGVISGAAAADRAAMAMNAVDESLVRQTERLILLLAPPFDQTPLEPGYIKGYLPGTRENGGQYTHASVWVVLANALLGRNGRAMELLDLLNPIHHTAGPMDVARYRIEPYALAGDVYSMAPNTSRGGWSWYTGAAGWFYRVALETVLGFDRHGNRLAIRPRVPDDWPEYEITYRFGSATYHIVISRESAGTTVDGSEVAGEWLELHDDGKLHEVRISLRRNGTNIANLAQTKNA